MKQQNRGRLQRSYSALYFCPVVQNLMYILSVLCNAFHAELKMVLWSCPWSSLNCALPAIVTEVGHGKSC